MNDWFEWNGVKCTDLGIHVSEHPPITISEPRVTFTEVPGRPGSLTTVEDIDVYEDMVLPITCFIENTARINEIAGYLKGAGKVVFANRADGFYYARIVNQMGITTFDPAMFENQIDHITVCDNRKLVFSFRDGNKQEEFWQEPSRKDSWTPEMRAEAADKKRRKSHE